MCLSFCLFVIIIIIYYYKIVHEVQNRQTYSENNKQSKKEH